MASSRSAVIAVCGVLLWSAPACLANLAEIHDRPLESLPSPVQQTFPASVEVRYSWPQPAFGSDTDTGGEARYGQLNGSYWCGSAGLLHLPLPTADSRSECVTELPPLPSGQTLAFTGLLTLAAVQLGRSVRQLRDLPDRYYCDCMEQMGPAVAPDVHIVLMQVWWFMEAEQHRPAMCPRQRSAFVSRLSPQCILTLAGPRGPPLS